MAPKNTQNGRALLWVIFFVKNIAPKSQVGHRILHEWLWDYHQFHHCINTPTPVSTACIDPLDATLQAGLPRLAAVAWEGVVNGSREKFAGKFTR